MDPNGETQPFDASPVAKALQEAAGVDKTPVVAPVASPLPELKRSQQPAEVEPPADPENPQLPPPVDPTKVPPSLFHATGEGVSRVEQMEHRDDMKKEKGEKKEKKGPKAKAKPKGKAAAKAKVRAAAKKVKKSPAKKKGGKKSRKGKDERCSSDESSHEDSAGAAVKEKEKEDEKKAQAEAKEKEEEDGQEHDQRKKKAKVGEEKATFARRNRPLTQEPAKRWDSLKMTFNTRVAQFFAHPSSMEAPVFSKAF